MSCGCVGLPCSVKLMLSVAGLDPLKYEDHDAAAAESATNSMLNCTGGGKKHRSQ